MPQGKGCRRSQPGRPGNHFEAIDGLGFVFVDGSIHRSYRSLFWTGPMQWQPRDKEILLTLGIRTTAAALPQLAETFFGGSIAAARARMNKLEHQTGLFGSFRASVQLLAADAIEPVCINPGGPCDAGRLSHVLQGRWNKVSTRVQTVYFVSAHGASVLGLTHRRPRLKSLQQLSHDLGLMSIYTYLVRNHPELAGCVQAEHRFRNERAQAEKVEDVLVAIDGEPKLCCEFVGASSYPPSRIRALVEDCCNRRNLPLWIF